MIRAALLSMVLLINHALYAQNNGSTDSADLIKKTLFKLNFEKSFQQKIDEIDQTYKGKIKNNMIEKFKNFSKMFLEEIDEDNLYFDAKFEELLTNIYQKILKSSAKTNENSLVAIKKENSMNAYCLPNGAIIVNMGAFDYLANENQLAAVLAHEIGHKHLNHNLVSLEKYLNQSLSTQQKEKVIKRKKYNKSKLALDLTKKSLYENAKNDRKIELEADSIGYVIYKNAGFEVGEYLEAMKKIEDHKEMQDQLMVDSLTFVKIFDLPKQPFNEKWLKNEDFSHYNYDLYKNKIDKDSISTHPEWKHRMEQITKKFPELLDTKNHKKLVASNEFLFLKKTANEQRIENIVFAKEYGLAVYLCLYEMQNNKNNDFYAKWLGKLFQKLAESYDKYELNNHLVHKNPKIHSKNYLFFLNFMWNLNYNEMKNIASYYAADETNKQ
jgi:hypothetical protein